MQPKQILLKSGKAYSKYDVTGDSKKDTISLKYSFANNKNKLLILVNGKEAGTITVSFEKEGGKYEAYLCTVNPKNVFLSIRFESNMNDLQVMHKMYKYQQGKFNSILNVQKALKITGMECSSINRVDVNGIIFGAKGITSHGYRNESWPYSLKNGKLVY